MMDQNLNEKEGKLRDQNSIVLNQIKIKEDQSASKLN